MAVALGRHLLMKTRSMAATEVDGLTSSMRTHLRCVLALGVLMLGVLTLDVQPAPGMIALSGWGFSGPRCVGFQGTINDSVVASRVLKLSLVSDSSEGKGDLSYLGESVTAWDRVTLPGMDPNSLSVIQLWSSRLLEAKVTSLVVNHCVWFGGIRGRALTDSAVHAATELWNGAVAGSGVLNVRDRDGARAVAALFLNFVGGHPVTLNTIPSQLTHLQQAAWMTISTTRLRESSNSRQVDGSWIIGVRWPPSYKQRATVTVAKDGGIASLELQPLSQ